MNEDLVPAPAGALPSYRAIENLIAAYAELVDGGDFTGLGTLLADATFTGSGTPVSGPDAIEKMFSNTLINEFRFGVVQRDQLYVNEVAPSATDASR